MARFVTLMAAVAATLVVGATASAARQTGVEAAPADEHFVFDVRRNGEAIGTHEIRLDYEGNGVRASIDTRLRVRFLGFTVYRLDYSAVEEWSGDRLDTLRVEVNNNGEARSLHGRRSGEAFELTGNEGTRSLPLPLFPTNHWNPRVLEQSVVLNTLTGRLNRVTIREVGPDRLPLPADHLPATRYRYEGDLNLESWYDRSGRWVAMDFQAEDGSVIEYRCRNCTAADG